MALLRYGVLALAFLLALPLQAQTRDATLPRVSPNASVSLTLGLTDVTVHYGAPSARDREVFGGLVPFGEMWRVGANEATAFTVSTDVRLEGEALAAGTYGLFAVPGEDAWTIVLNRVAAQWGAYQYDEASDVLRVRVTPRAAPFAETMTFTFEDLDLGGAADAATLVLRWADVAVPIRIETDTPEHLLARADAALAEDGWERPFQYARYALMQGLHTDRARTWAEAAAQRNEAYATLALQARLHAAAGDQASAAVVGARALALAEAMPQAPRDLEAFRAELATWQP